MFRSGGYSYSGQTYVNPTFTGTVTETSATWTGDKVPTTTGTYDLGVTGTRWRAAYLTGTYNTSGTTAIDNGNMKIVGSASTGILDGNSWRFRNYAGTDAPTTVAILAGANAQEIGFKSLTELTTIAAAATTDTTIQMPAGAIVLAVSVRVTTVIPTAATFTVGDSGSAARFSTAAVSTAATSTDAGTKAGAYYNASALSIRITPNAQPATATGVVRVTIIYLLSSPPTS